MLTEETLNNAASIADMLADDGLVVQAMEGTPVDSLNAAMKFMTIDEITDVKTVLRKSAAQANGFDPHNVELNKIASIITKKLGGLHRLARGVINDLIRDITKQSYEKQAELRAQKPIDLKIIPTMAMDIYDDQMLVTFLSRFGTARGPMAKRMPEDELEKIADFITPDTFIQCAKTGSEDIDNAVAKFVKENGAYAGSIFKDTRSMSGNIVSSYARVDDLAYALFLRGLMNGKLPDYSLEDQPKFVALAVADAMRAHAEALVQRVNMVTKHEAAGGILIGVVDNAVYVNHVRYMTWIKDNGGSAEAVMASFLENGRTAAAFKMAMDAPERYSNLYKMQTAKVKNVTNAKVNASVENIAFSVMSNWITGNEKLENDAKVEKSKALVTFVKETPYLGAREVHEWARQLVCKVVAPNTQVYAMLNSMEVYMEDNPEATVQQAAVQASSFVIANWIADQLVVTKVSNDRLQLGTKGPQPL